MHEFGTCKENAAVQCRLPTNLAAKHVKKSEVGTAQRHSVCSTELMNRPTSVSPLHSDIKNTYLIRMDK